jgi:APA family basic amino acid/polyamine antiporter
MLTNTEDSAKTDAPVLHLRRTLGLGRAVALGLSGTIGGGIFVLVGPATAEAGPGILLAFVLAFLAALLFALPYAELACLYPRAGGGYAATRATLGPWWGFVMGWGYWGAWVAVGGYVTLGFGGYLHALTGLPAIPIALVLTAAITALNLCNTHLVGRTQAAVIILGGGALVAFGVLGLPHAHAHAARFVPFLPHGLGGVALATPAALLALNGFDAVAAAGEEIVRPEDILPRTILLTLLIALGVYLLVTIVAVGALPYTALGASSTPLAAAARIFLGPAGSSLISIAALLTTASTANAALGAGSRIVFGMARDGALPRGVGLVQARNGSPWVAVLITGAALAIVAASGSVTEAAAVGGFLYVLHYAFPLVGLARLRLRPGPVSGFRTPAPRLTMPLAGAALLFLLGASGRVGLVGGLGWLLVGVLAYAAGRVTMARKAPAAVGAVRPSLPDHAQAERRSA